MRIMKDVERQITAATRRTEIEVARAGVQKIKELSPKDTGLYASGWTFTLGRGGPYIHNTTRPEEPELALILEYGYAKLSGGRVAAQPHIRPAIEGLATTFIRQFEKEMSK